MATAPSGLLCPPSPSPFRFRVPFQFRVLCLRRAAGRGLPGGVVSGGVVPGGGRLRGEGSLERASLARARRSHGERRAALAGPVHSPGHQLCGHSLPVFRVPAEGPGRPGAQGAVRSVKETLNSQFVENCKGVIQRLTLQEHKMVWNRTTHLWNDCSKIIHQRTNTVPFDLVPHEDGAGVAVRVLKPLDAVDLGLETVYERFHPSTPSFTDVVGHYLSGERPKGVQETEEMLKVGAPLTGVGELVLDHSCVRLQPPKGPGMQYYLSSQDFDSLLQRQESSVRLWKVLALVFGFAACASLFFLLRKQYLRRRRERQRPEEEFRERACPEEDRPEEDREGPKGACVVCLSNFRSCVFLECGHVCACTECYRALPEPRRCPICRQEISRVVRLYNS
uniref:Mitochondrial ubiquitin ligase activator of NFKB 1 n=1 Tax=Bos mutus grunniens TaxID=30521 RepID=A0A8B9WRQ2_BOSMU